MKRICIGLLLLLSNQLVAQITYGPKLGVGISPVDYKIVQDYEGGDDTYENPKNNYMIVPMVFGMVDITLNKTFSLRSGFGFRQQSFSYIYSSSDGILFQAIYFTRTNIVTSRLSFLEIPLYVSTQLPFCKRKFELIVGGSVGFNLGGNAHVDQLYSGDPRSYTLPPDESYETDVDVGSNPNNPWHSPYSKVIYSSKYNYSILLGLGYKVTDRVLLNLETSFGISNLRPPVLENSYTTWSGDKGGGFVSTKSLSMSVSYMFGGKKRVEE